MIMPTGCFSYPRSLRFEEMMGRKKSFLIIFLLVFVNVGAAIAQPAPLTRMIPDFLTRCYGASDSNTAIPILSHTPTLK